MARSCRRRTEIPTSPRQTAASRTYRVEERPDLIEAVRPEQCALRTPAVRSEDLSPSAIADGIGLAWQSCATGRPMTGTFEQEHRGAVELDPVAARTD